MAIMAAMQGSAAPGRAIALAVAGGALLTISDAGLKYLAEELPPGQIMFIRGVIAGFALIMATLGTRGAKALKPQKWRLHLARGLTAAVATFTYLIGIGDLPLATATSILFASPILLTALAPMFIGELVGWRRWCAVIAGFVGVLIIVRPAGDAFQWAAVMILLAALGESVRDLITRGASGRETTHSMLFTMMVIAAATGLFVPPYDWLPLSGVHWLIIIMASLIWTSAHFLLIEAFQYGEAALLAPFKYCNLFFAAILGFLVWGDLPDWLTWAGSAVIIASGLYILHREVLRRAPVMAADPILDAPAADVPPQGADREPPR
ncbi:MAG: EamA family transporter [Rhodospirillales bacterium CG15_BIG_FIL_POST_REV_8_21_14_020_66_15]|nr:MAG: EamA family transporter [Rhodospirillales bacterium CG15_BIG_FIL_POST_REV_8_21_14_020_66_15]